MNGSEIRETFINVIIFFLIIIIAIISFCLKSLNFGAVIIFILLITHCAYSHWKEIKKQKEWTINDIKKEDRKMKNQHLNLIRAQMEYYKILDFRLQQRENYVLVAESMLLLSYITASTPFMVTELQMPIATTGVIITFLWYLANLRILIQSDSVLKEYLFRGFIKRSIISVRHQPSGKLLLHDILPSAIFILWIYLLIYSLIQINVNEFTIGLLPYVLLIILGFKLFTKVLLPRNDKL